MAECLLEALTAVADGFFLITFLTSKYQQEMSTIPHHNIDNNQRIISINGLI
jgi:hypothetical protein